MASARTPPASSASTSGGKALVFRATAGIDDESGQGGTAEFRDVGDGKLLWSSGALCAAAARPRRAKFRLTGVKILDLIVDTTPDGFANDHTDWAEASIEYIGSSARRPSGPARRRSARQYVHRWPPKEQVFHEAVAAGPHGSRRGRRRSPPRGQC